MVNRAFAEAAHDWIKSPNDLVMWVCNNCKLALSGYQSGKPDIYAQPSCTVNSMRNRAEAAEKAEEHLVKLFAEQGRRAEAAEKRAEAAEAERDKLKAALERHGEP